MSFLLFHLEFLEIQSMPTFLTAHRRTSKAAMMEGRQSHFYYSFPENKCAKSFEKQRLEAVELRGPNEGWDPAAIHTV